MEYFKHPKNINNLWLFYIAVFIIFVKFIMYREFLSICQKISQKPICCLTLSQLCVVFLTIKESFLSRVVVRESSVYKIATNL